MTLMQLYLANGDWDTNTIIEVYSLNTYELLYKGKACEVPFELSRKTVAFFSNTQVDIRMEAK